MSAAADSIQKGGEVFLTDKDASLRKVKVGIGWDVPEKHEGIVVDIDVSAFLLNRENRVRRDTDFVFYNNLDAEEKAVVHQGDNTTGAGDGDDEVVEVELDKVPYDVDRVTFTVTIHNAEERAHTFSLVKNAYIRVLNAETEVELARYDLSEDAGESNALIFGALEREAMGWKFKAIGDAKDGGLYRLARDFAVNVAPP